MTRNREGWAGVAPNGSADLDGFFGAVPSRISTSISGRMPASSQASSELSTASFTVVNSAFAGLSKPRRWRFFVKNSLTEMSRWRVAIDSAVARLLGCVASSGASVFFGIGSARNG